MQRKVIALINIRQFNDNVKLQYVYRYYNLCIAKEKQYMLADVLFALFIEFSCMGQQVAT